MHRREFLSVAGAASLSVLWPSVGLGARLAGAASPYERLLILVELKGGNDGLNTVIPYADANYARLRPSIGIARDVVLPISEQLAFNPALQSLMPLWKDRQLAILQGVGYPQPNLSHFRSIEIWDTASASTETLSDGWLARVFSAHPPPVNWAADAIAMGSADMGPLTGAHRAVVLSGQARVGAAGSGGATSMTERFAQRAQALPESRDPGMGPHGASTRMPDALQHVLDVESDVRQAGKKLAGTDNSATHTLRTTFPDSPFGATVRSACEVVASGAGVAALRLTLNGFDTHQNQPGIHARLLRELADGLAALQAGLTELQVWDRSLVLTYAEFGRRAAENRSRGTDHGTANVHFALGGRVRGGLYGAQPALDRLDGNGNLTFAIDFRNVYATMLERWWQMDSREALRGRFPPLDFLA